MATTHWRTGHTVADLLGTPDAGWHFHQLVRLMVPPGTNEQDVLETLEQQVEFVASQARDFPPGDIRRVEPAASEEDKTRVTCSGYNLAGIGHPLPEPFVEMMMENVHHGDGAMAAFIDLFNTRLQALRYLVRARTDNTLASSTAEDTLTGRLMLSLSGHLSEAKRAISHQSVNTLVGLAGMLANCRMALPTIRTLFKVVLNLELICVNSLLGRWLTVEKSDRTLLGRANHRLGEEATLGKKIWDQQAAFSVELGPMPLERLEQLVPGGEEHHELKRLLEWVSDKRCDCEVILVCEKDTAKVAKLGWEKNRSNALAFGSWLSGGDGEHKRVSFMLELAQ